MANTPIEVGYMKKIGLAVAADPSKLDLNLDADPLQVKFIYGVGTEGLSLFEKVLFGKHPGDEIELEVNSFRINEALGHLKPVLRSCLPGTPSFFIKARVLSVETASNREVVQAIAANVAVDSCGCGGDCGCGCG